MLGIQTITQFTRLIRNLGIVIGIPLLGGVGIYYHTVQLDALREQLSSCRQRNSELNETFLENMKIKAGEIRLLELLRCDQAEKYIKSTKAVYDDIINKATSDIESSKKQQDELEFRRALREVDLLDEIIQKHEDIKRLLAERLVELKEREAEEQRQTTPLNAIIDATLMCESDTTPILWQEFVSMTKSIPPTGATDFKLGTYIARGCLNTAGQKHGDWMAWYSNGQVVQQGKFAEGKRVGHVTTFYEDGTKAAQWVYENGNLVNDEIIWDRNGNELVRKAY